MLDPRHIPGAAPTPAPDDRGEVAVSPFSGRPSFPARAAGGLIWVYQRTVSPALSALNPACGCRFSPTCSHYARTALHDHGLLAGSWLTVRRLLKCGPWHAGGEDPVPPARFSCTRLHPTASAKS